MVLEEGPLLSLVFDSLDGYFFCLDGIVMEKGKKIRDLDFLWRVGSQYDFFFSLKGERSGGCRLVG